MTDQLGTVQHADLGHARIRYYESGEGSPVVFVHGLLTNAHLWRKVVPTIAAAGHRCIAPDWPLGSHSVAVPDADLTPPGVADLIAEFLEALDLRHVTLVANDTGGAMTQILMARHPERIARVVLTPADSFERFFPPVFVMLPLLARVPGAVWLLTQTLRLRSLQRLPITFGWVSKRPIARDIVDTYLDPSRHDRAIRADLRRFLRTVHKRHTLAAAERLGGFTKPVLLAWATEDKLFPLSLAHRLQQVLPNSRLIEIADSYTFIPEDNPEALIPLILNFIPVDVA